MLKKLSINEAVARYLDNGEPVYIMSRIDDDMTLGELRIAAGFCNEEADPAELIDPTEALNVAMAQDPERRNEEPADPDPVPGTNKQRVPDAVFRELHAKKMTNREIAKELGYSEATVHTRLTKLGLQRHRD